MEHDPGFTYLALAYAGFFLVLAGFVWRLERRSLQLERDLEALQARTAQTRAGSRPSNEAGENDVS